LNFLLDTNILSELRKGPQCDRGVNRWLAGCEDEQLFTSVLCLGEIRMGIDALRPRDSRFAARLQLWLDYIIDSFEGRILPVGQAIALEWGRLAAPVSRAPVDELLAATALTHRMTLVTRNVRDVERTGVEYLNPFLPIH
jgi:predicted nucleic acid-binding protein